MKYLNLGCGNRFHTDWINVNFTSPNPVVIAHNLTKDIPFSDNSFDVVYHSHLLEHFPKAEAATFLQECHRVLRPQGILRIAVPDLEQIIRSYLFALEQALDNSLEAANNYTWLLLELFDQMVRNQAGGEMIAYLHQENIPNETFILKRLGTEAKNIIASGCQTQQISLSKPWFKHALRPIYRVFRDPHYRQNIFLKRLLSSADYQALQIGRFRQSGEIHQWMYDRYSLAQLLQQNGFEKIQQRPAHESAILHWSSFNLDTEPNGSVYKPDSLYMEAIKPA
ncbi:MAG: Methyltransferase domain [Phormidesmis priestleyi Ana]|uniref:Methyltransferase domain n=1 Tax=Phormidesmis priestleyi Ana TaxID=1666911 RepID=A0A0P8DBY7_9CYAN|nr:MAG: Methyltransferase domain [Phormidesmis priestleyi Ana]